MKQAILNCENKMEHCQWQFKNKLWCTNETNYNTEVLKSNLCDYNDAYDAYYLAKGDVAVRVAPATQAAFKNCAPVTRCITKIDGTTINDAKDLDLVIPMYNLIECSSNYSDTTGSLWF